MLHKQSPWSSSSSQFSNSLCMKQVANKSVLWGGNTKSLLSSLGVFVWMNLRFGLSNYHKTRHWLKPCIAHLNVLLSVHAFSWIKFNTFMICVFLDSNSAMPNHKSPFSSFKTSVRLKWQIWIELIVRFFQHCFFQGRY